LSVHSDLTRPSSSFYIKVKATEATMRYISVTKYVHAFAGGPTLITNQLCR